MNSLPQAKQVEHDPFGGLRQKEFPTATHQSSLWAFAHSGREQAVCTQIQSLSVRLDGQLDSRALREAVQLLTEFHEALRGHYSADGQRFVIEPTARVPIAVLDLSGLPGASRTAALNEIIAVDSLTSFDLVGGPLFRCSLVQLTATSTVVIISAHAAVCDGWSMDVVLADLAHLYSGLVGRAPLPRPPRHAFSDYMVYRTSPPTESGVAKATEYWVRRLAAQGGSAAPSDGDSRPLDLRSRYGTRPLSPSLLKELRALARAQGVSLFALLVSALGVLESGKRGPQIVLGIPIAGQPVAEMEDCVGPLVSLVPLVLRCEPAATFMGFCQDVAKELLNSRDNALSSLPEIESAAKAAGIEVPSPLVSTVLTHVQKFAPGKLVFGELASDYQLNPRAVDAVDLNVTAFESAQGLILQAQGRAAVTSAAQLEQALHDLERVLTYVSAGPETSLAEILNRLEAAPVVAHPPGTAGGDRNGVQFADSGWTATEQPPSDERYAKREGGFQTAATKPGFPGPRDEIGHSAPIVVTLRQGRKDTTPLLCLFGIQLYVDLALALDKDTPVIGIHVPMLYVPGKTPRPTLPQVVSRYVEVVREVQPHGPYRLAGLCYGGVTAFEVARSLRESGEEVAQVVIFDSVLSRGSRTDHVMRARTVAQQIVGNPREAARRTVRNGLAYGRSLLLRSPFRSTAELLLARVNAVEDQTPVDLQVLGPESFADVAQFEASSPFLDAPVVVFRATQTEQSKWVRTAPHMGWEGLARLVEAHDVSSDHIGIVRPPHVRQVADAIARNFAHVRSR